MKPEQLELFQYEKPNTCVICNRVIKHGIFGDRCYDAMMENIDNHKQAIEYCKSQLTKEVEQWNIR